MDKFMIKRAIFLIIVMFIGFSFGLFLGFSFTVAKAMDYDIGQAIALLPAPIDEYQPEPTPDLPEPVTTYLGTYTVSAYCPCSICCGKWSNPDNPRTASGTTPAECITVGADWDKLQPGTRIYIDGVGERIVEDKVAGWVAEKYDGLVLDLFYYNHKDALAFGKQVLDVWKVNQ